MNECENTKVFLHCFPIDWFNPDKASRSTDAPVGCTESVEFSLHFGKSYLCLAKASGDTSRLSVGAATAFFSGLSARSRTIAWGICTGTCAHDAGERAYTVVLFVCLPTNIEISSLTFNITGANVTHIRVYTYTHIHAYMHACTTRMHEVRRSVSSPHPPLLDSMRREVKSKDEAGMNSPRTTQCIRDSIRIEYK